MISLIFPKDTRIERYLGYAKRSEKNGSLASARSYYKNVLQIDRKNITALEGFVKTSNRETEILEAESLLNKLLKDSPFSTDSIYTKESFPLKLKAIQAQFYFQTNRGLGGERVVDKIDSLNLSDRDKLHILSTIFINSNQFERAEKLILSSDYRKSYSPKLFDIYSKQFELIKSAGEVKYLIDSDSLQNIVSKILPFFESMTIGEKDLFLEEIKKDRSKDIDFIISSLYYNMKDYENSLSFLNKESSVKLIKGFGKKLINDKEYSIALNFYNRISERDSEIVKDISTIYYHTDLLEELEKLYKTYPENNVLLNLVKLLFKRGEFKRTENLINENPNILNIDLELKLIDLKLDFLKYIEGKEKERFFYQKLSNLRRDRNFIRNRKHFGELKLLNLLFNYRKFGSKNLEESLKKIKGRNVYGLYDNNLIESINLLGKSLETDRDGSLKYLLSMLINIDFDDIFNSLSITNPQTLNFLKYNFFIERAQYDRGGDILKEAVKSDKEGKYEDLLYRYIKVLEREERKDQILSFSSIFMEKFSNSIYKTEINKIIRKINREL
ncbi:MAG: hypothetical protein CR982_05955 [Candidatus Cloacimonadota bacterium]|nr:MAG: hypothetical protein CR982_05955 [Candidatus Cloacimonadota bacterium]PIE78064.1 MAG: hypothetical protein CSA15_09515 [Candidatus Delongbacteria bacterium]